MKSSCAIINEIVGTREMQPIAHPQPSCQTARACTRGWAKGLNPGAFLSSLRLTCCLLFAPCPYACFILASSPPRLRMDAQCTGNTTSTEPEPLTCPHATRTALQPIDISHQHSIRGHAEHRPKGLCGLEVGSGRPELECAVV